MSDNMKELDLGMLDEIAGGRYMTADERNNLDEVLKMVTAKANELISKGLANDASDLTNRFWESVSSWLDAIRNAEEGTANIPFSDFFTL